MTKEKEEIINQDFEAQVPAEEEKLNLWQRFKAKIKTLNKKHIYIGAGVFVFLVLILIIARSSLHISRFKPPVFPSPSPSPYEEEITNPSAYATDSAVLEIGEKLKEIEGGIDQTDLKETGLNPPVLDLEVNFEE
ncbi:hypothetical protein KKI19_01825 [Patescibacteria group bacterium]|nr:hypothetical protein [Patescibacteria group bacterium]